MKRIVTILTAALVATPGLAQVGAEQLQGTWECYGPGQTSPHTPPIVFFGDAKRDDKGMTSIEIDAFSRAVAGNASLTSEADGWTKVSATTGSPLFIKGYTTTGSKVSMQLRREGAGSYRCYRLPRYGDVMIPRDRVIEKNQ